MGFGYGVGSMGTIMFLNSIVWLIVGVLAAIWFWQRVKK